MRRLATSITYEALLLLLCIAASREADLVEATSQPKCHRAFSANTLQSTTEGLSAQTSPSSRQLLTAATRRRRHDVMLPGTHRCTKTPSGGSRSVMAAQSPSCTYAPGKMESIEAANTRVKIRWDDEDADPSWVPFARVKMDVTFNSGVDLVKDVHICLGECQPWCTSTEHQDTPWSQKCVWPNGQCSGCPRCPCAHQCPSECNICPNGHGKDSFFTDGVKWHKHPQTLAFKYISGLGDVQSAARVTKSGNCGSGTWGSFPTNAQIIADPSTGDNGQQDQVVQTTESRAVIITKSKADDSPGNWPWYTNGEIITFQPKKDGAKGVFATENTWKVRWGGKVCELRMHISCSDDLKVGDRLGPFEIMGGQ